MRSDFRGVRKCHSLPPAPQLTAGEFMALERPEANNLFHVEDRVGEKCSHPSLFHFRYYIIYFIYAIYRNVLLTVTFRGRILLEPHFCVHLEEVSGYG